QLYNQSVIIRGEAWMQIMSSRSEPTLLNLCGVSAPTTTDVAGVCDELVAVCDHVSLAGADDPCFRVRMCVQLGPGAGLAVDEEEGDAGPVRFAFEGERAAGAALLFARSKNFEHRCLLSWRLEPATASVGS